MAINAWPATGEWSGDCWPVAALGSSGNCVETDGERRRAVTASIHSPRCRSTAVNGSVLIQWRRWLARRRRSWIFAAAAAAMVGHCSWREYAGWGSADGEWIGFGKFPVFIFTSSSDCLLLQQTSCCRISSLESIYTVHLVATSNSDKQHNNALTISKLVK